MTESVKGDVAGVPGAEQKAAPSLFQQWFGRSKLHEYEVILFGKNPFQSTLCHVLIVTSSSSLKALLSFSATVITFGTLAWLMVMIP